MIKGNKKVPTTGNDVFDRQRFRSYQKLPLHIYKHYCLLFIAVDASLIPLLRLDKLSDAIQSVTYGRKCTILKQLEF